MQSFRSNKVFLEPARKSKIYLIELQSFHKLCDEALCTNDVIQ